MKILQNGNDDPVFFDWVENVAFNLVNRHSPDEVFVIRIDNWFDHKWLKFSGKGVVEFPERGVDLPRRGHLKIESALGEFHKEKITFPPFTPKRVIKQQYFKLPGVKEKKLIHRQYKEFSNINLQNRVDQYSTSGVFIWFSSNSVNNIQGSIMAYISQKEGIDTWYASFHKLNDWKINRVKGIDQSEVERLLIYED